MNLAINGGKPIRQNFFPAQETVGEEEKKAVEEVLDSGILSYFRGSYIPAFWGGPQILDLEKEFASKFNSAHAIAVNSCTSALQIACGAIGLQPGDEVIVTPWSMSCSATAPIIWGAKPVFADIEEEYFCLDPKSIEEKITNRTKAIIVVDLFGQPYDVEAINAIADKHGLCVIEDAAQAIGSKYINDYAGTLGDIGAFSFTQGKHLTSGEGGILTTNDSELAMGCSLIRNHAEAVINDMPTDQFSRNAIGYNMRMTEIQAAIIREQLKKLNRFIEQRLYNARLLNHRLSQIPAITPAEVRSKCTHSYYVASYHFDQEIAGVHRDKFINAVKAELTGEEGRTDKGVPIGNGYIKPLYLFPLFQKGQHWVVDGYDHLYKEGTCPVAEKLWKDDLFVTTLPGLSLDINDINDIAKAFYKVWEHREEIK